MQTPVQFKAKGKETPLSRALLGSSRVTRYGRAPLVALVFLLVATFEVAGEGLKQPEETLPGFKAHSVFESKGIENLSLFNGDPQLAVPLGPEYPTGPGSSFRLTAFYSTRFWHMYEVQCGTNAYCGTNHYPRAHVRGLPSLGVGWTLELGSIDPSPTEGGQSRYLSPDGGIHEFNDLGVGVQAYPHDDLAVRIEKLSSGGYVVRQADGTSLWLTHRYTRPPSRNGADFSDVDRGALYPRTERWGLEEMRDAFNKTLLTVEWQGEYPSANAWKVDSIRLGSPSRVIQFGWGIYTVPGQSNPWDVVSWIRFPILASPATALTVSFGYAPSGKFMRTSFDSGTETGCPPLAPEVPDLPFLASISHLTGPDRFEYSFEYSLGDTRNAPDIPRSTGLLTAFRLPTGTRVEYAYGSITAGRPCFLKQDSACSLEEGPPEAAYVTDPEPICDSWSRVQRFLDAAPAVIRRTETDPTVGSIGLSATTTYDRRQFAERDTSTPNSRNPDPQRILRRVVVRRPSGNGSELLATRHVFHVLMESSVGSAGPGVEVERRHYAGSLAAGAAVRSISQCYYDDNSGSEHPTACGALKGSSEITPFFFGGSGKHLSREVTWYGTNPMGAEDCTAENSTQAGVACHTVEWTGWNRDAREFEKVTTRAPRSGPSRILLQDGLKERSTTTTWAPTSGTNYWQPKLYISREVADVPEGGNCSFPPCAIKTETSFDPTTGALNSSTIADAPSLSRTISLGYDGNGNPVTETVSGEGLAGTYRTTRTFQSGLVTSSRRTLPANIGWYQFDVTRDAALGLISVSRDPNSLATSYSWDSLGRLTRIAPPDGESMTTICYRPWAVGSPGAWALLRRGGSAGCGTTAAQPAEGSETVEAYVYDGSGRLSREIRLLPNSVNGRYLAARITERNEIGLVSAVSEWEPCGSGTDLSTCFASTATRKTVFSNFDLFGRPRSIALPDGTAVTKSYDDRDEGGAFLPATDTRENTWTTNVADGTTFQGVRKDLFGRLLIVAEPKLVSEPGDTGPLTFHRYDVHDQVAEVKAQPLLPRGDAREQVRLFKRNSFGFLTSETHPETGMSPTTWGSFTALGHPQSMTSGSGAGAVTRTTTYDALGRVLTISSGSVYLDSRWDGEGQARPDKPFGRLTHQLSYNPGTSAKERIEEWFTFDGLGGRLSKREVTISGTGFPTLSTQESWAYDSFGSTIRHSRPASAGSRGFVESRTIRAGYLAEVRGNGLPVVRDIQYGAAGQLQRYTTGPGTSNDIVTVIEPDPSGMARPRSIRATRGGQPLFETGTYSWDGAGNILAMGDETFAYDARSRLKRAGATTFQYDAFGNLTGTSTEGDWTVDPATNRIAGHTYDSRGNVLSAGSEAYTWDALNRMTSQTSLGQSYRYAYDGAGERLVRSASSGSRTFTFRNPEGQVTTELLAGGLRVRENVFLGSLLVGSLGSCGVGATEPGWTYYSSDHLGSPRLFSRFRNAKTEERRYTPYGREAVGPVSDQSQRVRFAAMERDPESENRYYDHARSHDARFGRFLSMDPAPGNPADPASWNRYTYARNNPLKYVDPDGREEMDAVLMSTQRMQLREMGGEAAVQRFDRTNLAMGGAALAGLAGGALLAPAEAALGGSTLPGLTSEVFNWGLSARGFAIEGAAASAAGGGALIRNFPTIDRFMNGLATSVKSLDLLSKTYQQGGRVLSTLTGYIDKLASFDGARRGGQVVGGVGSEIQRKMLEVAIQKGVATPQQIEQIKKAVEYAKTQGVGVRIYFVADK